MEAKIIYRKKYLPFIWTLRGDKGIFRIKGIKGPFASLDKAFRTYDFDCWKNIFHRFSGKGKITVDHTLELDVTNSTGY